MPFYLEATDSTISEEIMLTVAILGDKCATDYMFYVDVMVNLIILAVDLCQQGGLAEGHEKHQQI